ncbi:hypothetical protein IFM89_010692 [Coptis chinensis]|uniref:Proline dehydrogenase n=1 Tax=Coptis chinensis TaxID=261450 RepID=A0A835IPN7_9MAGN|nr:hypothetical protein IFM89_010692 [Coptis chinensis]
MHACYNECASFMVEKVFTGTGAVVLATHNLESGKVEAAKAQGFQVSKYFPYGPIEMGGGSLSTEGAGFGAIIRDHEGKDHAMDTTNEETNDCRENLVDKQGDQVNLGAGIAVEEGEILKNVGSETEDWHDAAW